MFCLIAFLSITFSLPALNEGVVPSKTPSSSPQIVLVAGSYGWTNYRHQADVCKLYTVLQKREVPTTNIITMMKDDIVEDKRNPFPGALYNHIPLIENIYIGTNRIDYKLFNGDTLRDVLNGNSNGRTVHRSSENLLIFMNAHGNSNLFEMTEPPNLSSDQLTSILHSLPHKNVLVLMESCKAGSMFTKLNENGNVYAIVSSGPNEDSTSLFCRHPSQLPCLTNFFSKALFSFIEENRSNTTVTHLFDYLRKNTFGSRVHEYGNKNLKMLRTQNFFN